MSEKDAEEFMAYQAIEDARMTESIAGFHFNRFVEGLDRRLATMEQKQESNQLQLDRIETMLATIARLQRRVLVPCYGPLNRRNNRRT